MKIKIVGKNVEVTKAMEEKIIEKLTKLEKYDYLKPETVCNVLIRTVKDDQIIEVTIHVGNKTIRAEKRSSSLYTAIDLVESTLTRQIRKEKEKMIGKKRTTLKELSKRGDNIVTPAIVKEKAVSLEIMTPDEAADRMEALDHDFHLFIDEDTENVSVVYRRKDSDYGVIYAKTE